MIIRLTPLDTFFFRDARSFEAGEDTWAQGVFPPPPSVLYGALASAYYAHKQNFHLSDDENTNSKQREQLQNFTITGLFLSVHDGRIILPIPKDVVKIKDKDELQYLKRKPNTLISSVNTQELLYSDEKAEEAKGYITDSAYQRVLVKDNINLSEFYNDILISEHKTGIGRDKQTYTTNEGELYSVSMQRFNTEKYKKCSIVIACEGIDLPKSGILKLGSKKAFSYTTDKDSSLTQNNFIAPPSKQDMKDNIFRLCFITPCIFQKGWIPEWLDENSLQGTVPDTNLKLELVTAVLGKPVLLGGFNMKARKGKGFPKPMYKMIPEGSVYYFRILEGTYEEVVEKFHFRSMSEKSVSKEANSSNNNTSKKGFGITCIGV
jgi:CRISPR-associated protein Cmr3